MLETALKLETQSIPALSRPLRAQLATACHEIGPDIAAALEGQQRVIFRALCAFVSKQVQEGILEPSAIQRTTDWTRPWKWVLGALTMLLLVLLRSRIRRSLHYVWLTTQSWSEQRRRDDAAQELDDCFQTLSISDWHLHDQLSQPYFFSSRRRPPSPIQNGQTHSKTPYPSITHPRR